MNTIISIVYAGTVVVSDIVFDNWILKVILAVIAFIVCYLANNWLQERKEFEKKTTKRLDDLAPVLQQLIDFNLSMDEIKSISNDAIKIALCNGLGKAIDEAVEKRFQQRDKYGTT